MSTSRRPIVAAAIAAAMAAAPPWSGGPAASAQGAVNLDLMVPSTAGQPVDRRSPPAYAELLGRRLGGEFTVYWDHELGTPRHVSPRTRVQVWTPGEGGEEGLVRAARAFLAAHREFLGVAEADLLGPSVRRVDESWLLSFRQAVGGIPVRGASLRLMVHADGRLAFLGAFLVREPRVEPADLMHEDLARIHAREEYGVEVKGLEQQVVFPTTEAVSARQAWCLSVEYPDTTVTELFLDENGARIAERPLEMGFGLCFQEPAAFQARGTAKGYSPDPEDIFTTAASRLEEYPIPGLHIRNHEGKEEITGANGAWEMNVAAEQGIYWPELTLGTCGTDEGGRPAIDRVFSIRRPNLQGSNCDSNAPVVPFEEVPLDVGNPIGFLINEGKTPADAFELMAFHHLRESFMGSQQNIRDYKVQQEPFFPFQVVIPRVQQELVKPDASPIQPGAYTPNEADSRICLSRFWNRTAYFPATIVHHEYAHHIVHSMTGSNQSIPMMEGIADALAAYKNDKPFIGFISPDDPGTFGFSLAEPIEALKEKVGVDRGTIGSFFWQLRSALRSDAKADNILYRWLACHHVKTGPCKTFEFSLVFLEEILDVDDQPGENGFPGADGDRETGTPHEPAIVPLFADWIGSVRFIRGDSNASGAVDLSDAVDVLEFLFLGGGRPDCFVAGDADRSGGVDLSDAVYVLGFLFLGGPPPEAPFPGCGTSEERLIWCVRSGCR